MVSLGVVLAAALTTTALAGTSTSCGGGNCVTTESGTFGPSTTDFTFSITLPEFVLPDGDTLTGITVDISGAFNAQNQALTGPLTVTNSGGITQTFALQLAEQVYGVTNSADSVGTSLNPFAYFINQSIPNSLSLASGASLPYCPTGAPKCLTDPTTFDSGALAVPTGDWLTDYVGQVVTLGGSTSALDNLGGGGGNISISDVSTGTISAAITYDYTDTPSGVPEPVSMGLLGSGLACLGLLKRKRPAR